MSLKSNASLRHDIICEKTRSPSEIRNEIAVQLKMWRRFRETCEYTCASIALVRARCLKWVLRHDTSCRKYYKEKYGREWPE